MQWILIKQVKHTQNILARVNKQQEVDKLATRLVEISSSKEPEHSTEDTLEDSDLDTTVFDNIKTSKGLPDDFRQNEGLVEPLGGVDAELQRSFCSNSKTWYSAIYSGNLTNYN